MGSKKYSKMPPRLQLETTMRHRTAAQLLHHIIQVQAERGSTCCSPIMKTQDAEHTKKKRSEGSEAVIDCDCGWCNKYPHNVSP